MDINESDLTSRIHKDSLLKKIRSNSNNIGKLLSWSLQKEQPLGWRATWLLRQVTSKNDAQIINVIPSVIELYRTFNHSQRREWLKTLMDQDIAEEYEGKLYDLCIEEWKNINNHPALRASALYLVFSLLRKYPELTNELTHLMTTDYLDALSLGIKTGIERQWYSFNE